MRNILVAGIVFFVAGASDSPAEEKAKATGVRDGKSVRFSEKSIGDGVKATLGLLESCHHEGWYQADELQKVEQGDHVRLVFPTAITVTVMRKKVEFSELVFRLPINTGVFWVRSGNEMTRYTKFEPQKVKPFAVWLESAQPVGDVSVSGH